MVLQHGRGKQSFRDFSKSLNDELKAAIQNIKDGEDLTANDIHRFADRIVNEYRDELRAQELDVELWLNKAIDYSYNKAEQIIERFTLSAESIIEDDPEENPEAQNDEFDPQDTDVSGGTLFGHQLLTKDNKLLVKSKGKPRKRFFTSLEELAKYVQNVPYILAIQIVKNADGKRIYRVWVEAAKDKYKRPKSA